MPLPMVQGGDHFATGDIQSSEQRSSSVANVIVALARRHSRAQRQNRPGPIESLNLTLLIHAQHQSTFRRVQVKTDNVTDFLNEEWVGRQLKGFHPMWLQRKRPPNARHR